MEYEKYIGRRYSDVFGRDVDILRYKSEGKIPYCDCSRCGKPITRVMYVVQDADDGVELAYLGPECIKHFS